MIRILFFIFLFSGANFIYAQPYKTIKVAKPYNWMFGVSWSTIDDNGKQFSKLFDVGGSWNLLAYPTKISADRYFKYGWSIEGSATYNRYKSGKLVNGSTDQPSFFVCVDVNGKYSFYNMYAPKVRWFEPYTTFGLGYTFRNNSLAAVHIPTLNAGIGFNFWLYQGLGIQLHSNAKFALFPTFWKTNGNYLQHSVGIVYRIGDRVSSPSDKKRYPWTRDNKKFRKKEGH